MFRTLVKVLSNMCGGGGMAKCYAASSRGREGLDQCYSLDNAQLLFKKLKRKVVGLQLLLLQVLLIGAVSISSSKLTK